MENSKRLAKINRDLHENGMVDNDYNNGLLGKRATILLLDRSLETNFDFYG